jgi:hypothetical protein
VCSPVYFSTADLSSDPPVLSACAARYAVLCCAGFREAEAVAKAELESAAFSNVEQPEAFRNDLLNIARTTLSSKILTGELFCALLLQLVQ